MPNTSAIRFAETGGPAVLQITEAELAEPGPGQALVGVHASGVNLSLIHISEPTRPY